MLRTGLRIVVASTAVGVVVRTVTYRLGLLGEEDAWVAGSLVASIACGLLVVAAYRSLRALAEPMAGA